MPEKIQHVLDQLPQHRTVLRERMVVDRDFRSLCEDYSDAFEALRHWEVSADAAEVILHHKSAGRRRSGPAPGT